MPITNTIPVTMINFANESYLNLLSDIIDYFNNKSAYGFDDTVIRYDEEKQVYVASVYILDWY